MLTLLVAIDVTPLRIPDERGHRRMVEKDTEAILPFACRLFRARTAGSRRRQFTFQLQLPLGGLADRPLLPQVVRLSRFNSEMI